MQKSKPSLGAIVKADLVYLSTKTIVCGADCDMQQIQCNLFQRIVQENGPQFKKKKKKPKVDAYFSYTALSPEPQNCIKKIFKTKIFFQ